MADLLEELLASERATAERWIRADTEFLARQMAPDAVYFDTYSPERLDGADAIMQHMHGIGEAMREMLRSRGRTQLDRFEILRPHLQQSGDMAVLTYHWVGHIDDERSRWRTTVVYERRAGAWRSIHAHWSAVQPPAPPDDGA